MSGPVGAGAGYASVTLSCPGGGGAGATGSGPLTVDGEPIDGTTGLIAGERGFLANGGRDGAEVAQPAATQGGAGGSKGNSTAGREASGARGQAPQLALALLGIAGALLSLF